MILIDTGPLVALFDPQDADHPACHHILQNIKQPLVTTDAVLTEVFHMLTPGNKGMSALMDFVSQGYVTVSDLEQAERERCFELMEKYQDQPMDYADATLIATAEKLGISVIFTLDLNDFSIYRIRKGYRQQALQLLGAEFLA